MAEATLTAEEQVAADAAKAKAEADAGKKPDNSKTWPDDEVRKIIEERDKAKQKLRAVDEEKKKAGEQKAIEEGKLKEVLAQKEAELAEAQKKAQAFEDQQKVFRDGLLSKITDPKLKSIAEELSIAKLQEFAESINTDRGSPFSAKGKQSEADKNEFVRLAGETWPQYQARLQRLRASKRK